MQEFSILEFVRIPPKCHLDGSLKDFRLNQNTIDFYASLIGAILRNRNDADIFLLQNKTTHIQLYLNYRILIKSINL